MEIISKNMHGYNIIHIYILYIHIIVYTFWDYMTQYIYIYIYYIYMEKVVYNSLLQ